MNEAVTACPVEDVQGDGRWMSIHQRFLMETKEREPEVLFVGDSLIAHLLYTDLWETVFEPLHPLNFGIGGDQTQHVLWRLKNGELDNIKPKVVVVLVGTNNHGHTPDMIADGIVAIVQLIRDMQPQAHVVAMSLLPRGHQANPLRERNKKTNQLLAERLASMERTQLIETDWSGFVQADQTISHLDMYDYLHLTPQGYRKVFGPVHELLLQLLNEDAASDALAAAATQPPTESTASGLKSILI